MENRTKAVIAVAVLVILAVAAYAVSMYFPGGNTSGSSSSNSAGDVNIGYFANINHAPALLGISTGAFQDAVGNSWNVKSFIFPSGGPEMTALLAGHIDIGYVGPSPSVNAFIQSNGTGLKIVAGVSNGGAVFVVQGDSDIQSPADFGGKTFGAPNLGNTQDVALRYYLMQHGYRTTDQSPPGNVTVKNSSPASVVLMFATHQVDGAWLPEPYGEALILQYGGRLFLDERTIWANNSFSTAVIVVRTAFLQQHPDVVRKIVSVDVNETLWINQHLEQAEVDMNSSIYAISGQGFSLSVLNASLNRLSFTFDPLKTSVAIQAEHAYELGWLAKEPGNLTGLYDLSILNSILTEKGLPTVS